jgi:hypothetical protein
MSRRRDNLSFQHHAEVAALPADEQDRWLENAERHDWNRNELRRRLAAERRPHVPMIESDGVVLRIQVAAPREQRWREAAIAAEKNLVDWVVAAADAACSGRA